VGSDIGLEELRRKRLQELRARLAEEQQSAETQKAIEQQKHALLRQILTIDARQRLNRIKLVKPEFAEQIELQIIQAAQTGRVKLPITDAQLKAILEKFQSARRDITFRRM